MRITWLSILLVAVSFGVLAGPPGYMFILDASNSMNDPWTAGKTKLAWAKEALIQMIQAIPENTAFGLVVFGHRLDPEPKAQSCADIELVLTFGTYTTAERSALFQKIRAVVAKGWTPLADSLKLAAAAAPTGTRIIVLTDGEETCDGDPLAVAADLCKRRYILDIVGMPMEAQVQAALKALAETCGGKFLLAQDAAKLPALLRELIAPPLPIPECLARYKVDPNIVVLLLQHLPYVPCVDPMWDVILHFLSVNMPERICVGTKDDDVLFGTPGNDLILGLGGNDTIYGFEGNDLLIGGTGNDLIQGGPGCDLILGGPGNDLLFGGPADDEIYGEEDDDRLEGEAGNDKLYGGPGCDILLAGPGCNLLDGGPGRNFLYDEGACLPSPVASPPLVVPSLPLAKTVEEGKSLVLRALVHDPDCDPVKVTWYAAKGRFSDPQATETVYYAPMVTDCAGELISITVVAEDACGARSSDTIVIHVRNVNRPPVADAGPDLSVPERGQVVLAGRAYDPDGDPIKVFWTVTAGQILGADTLCPVFIAPEVPGCEHLKVVAILRVVDACGAVSEDQVVITVLNVNRPPTVKADP